MSGSVVQSPWVKVNFVDILIVPVKVFSLFPLSSTKTWQVLDVSPAICWHPQIFISILYPLLHGFRLSVDSLHCFAQEHVVWCICFFHIFREMTGVPTHNNGMNLCTLFVLCSLVNSSAPAKYKAYCEHALLRSASQKGGRAYPPSLLEVNSLKQEKQMSLQFEFVDGMFWCSQNRVIWRDPCLAAGNVTGVIVSVFAWLHTRLG